MRHRFFLRAVGILLILLILFAFLTSLFFYEEIRVNFEAEIQKYGPLGMLVGGFVVDTVGGPLGPEIPVISGLLTGLPLHIILYMVMIGSASASLFIYAIGLLLGHYIPYFVPNQEQYEKWRHYFLNHGRLALLLGALTPVPYVTMCILGGVFRVKFWEFLVFAIGGRILRILGVAYLFILFGQVLEK